MIAGRKTRRIGLLILVMVGGGLQQTVCDHPLTRECDTVNLAV